MDVIRSTRVIAKYKVRGICEYEAPLRTPAVDVGCSSRSRRWFRG
jgi:hypothetical protein